MRIVSLAPSNTEILFAVGAGSEVVAVTRFCDYPDDTGRITKIGSWLRTEPDRLQMLKPDIILTSYFLPEPLRDWSGPGKVLHLEPKNLWDVFESIRVVGGAVGRERQADTVVRKMEKQFDLIRQNKPARSPRVYMEEWFDPPMAAGNWVPELVAIAGGEEVLAGVNQPSATFSLPALLVADPELIVCHWCGWGQRSDPHRILERSGWQDLSALQHNRVHFIDDALLNRPGPRLVDGAWALSKLFQNLLSSEFSTES